MVGRQAGDMPLAHRSVLPGAHRVCASRSDQTDLWRRKRIPSVDTLWDNCCCCYRRCGGCGGCSSSFTSSCHCCRNICVAGCGPGLRWACCFAAPCLAADALPAHPAASGARLAVRPLRARFALCAACALPARRLWPSSLQHRRPPPVPQHLVPHLHRTAHRTASAAGRQAGRLAGGAVQSASGSTVARRRRGSAAATPVAHAVAPHPLLLLETAAGVDRTARHLTRRAAVPCRRRLAR